MHLLKTEQPTLTTRVKNQSKFDSIFSTYYVQLYYFVFHIINDMEASKDIVSDAFEHVWLNIETLEEETIKSYLYTYVKNKSIDFLRHQSIHEKCLKFYSELNLKYVETEYVELDEQMLAIRAAMTKLTPHTRHILEECFIQRKQYKEVAEELNISVSAVRKHIVKSLKVIREECLKSMNKLD